MPLRRVLMIAHHFPPAGGSGANRALAFARYLPEYGWQPIVITPAAAWASNRDDDLLVQIPHDVRVVRTRSLESKPAPPLSRAPREQPRPRATKSALRAADKVILVTDRMAAVFRAQYPQIPSDRFAVVSNGFDPAQFSDPPPVARSQNWAVLHAGALYYGRSLSILLDAARQLIDAD